MKIRHVSLCFLFLFLFFQHFVAFAYSNEMELSVDQYVKDLQALSQKWCPLEIQEKGKELWKQSKRSQGYFPRDHEGKFDIQAFLNNKEFLSQKISWITYQEQLFSREEGATRLSESLIFLRPLEKLFSLIKLEQHFWWVLEFFKKSSSFLLSQFIFHKGLFKRQWKKYFQKFFFLTSFHYPVDLVALRKEYEHLPDKDSVKANTLYLYRMLVENGGLWGNKNDWSWRSYLHTIAQRVTSKNTMYFSVDLLTDISWLIQELKIILQRPVGLWREMLREWKISIQEYSSSLKKLAESSRVAKEYFENRNFVQHELQHFVDLKYQEVVSDVEKKPTWWQQLFVMETILQHEVGGLDLQWQFSPFILSLVYGRFTNPLYNKGNKKISSSAYLNVLFKKGEFSFTYPHFKASQEVFCPTFSSFSKRQERLLKIKKVLMAPEQLTCAQRYFSRRSMFGGVDMALIWTNFKEWDLSIGSRVEASLEKELKRLIKKGQWQIQEKKEEKMTGEIMWQVLVKENSWWYLPKKKHFFYWRSPDTFRFFCPKK